MNIREQINSLLDHAEEAKATCCCGMTIADHPSGMDYGHTPVSMWDHGIAGICDQVELMQRWIVATSTDGGLDRMGLSLEKYNQITRQVKEAIGDKTWKKPA